MRASRTASLLVPVLLALGGVPSTALGFSIGLSGGNTGEVLRWNKNTLDFYLHPACSADLDAAACLQELRDSFAAWTAPCAGVTFNDLGASTNINLTSIGGAGNGKNELAFIEDNKWTYGSYTLGVTGVMSGLGGSIIEADIAFNGLQQVWKMDGSFGSIDVKNVAVHEIGHYMGMQHVLSGYSPSDPPTMAPSAAPDMATRTPEPDDLAALCFLQPLTEYNCASDDDCPRIVQNIGGQESYVGVLTCENSLCGGVSNEIPQGDSDLGDGCVNPYDCKEGLSCKQISWNSQICTRNCDTTADCPQGFECQSAAGEDLCLEPGGASSSTGIGEPCQGDFSCLNIGAACVQSANGTFCRPPCGNFFGDCPPNEECVIVTFGIGGCVGPTDKKVGDECDSPGECAGALCKEGVCSGPCAVADGEQACENGTVCDPTGDGVADGLCVPPGDGELGSGCDSDDQCVTGLCHDGRCAWGCDPHNAACPDGAECVETTADLGYCVPPVPTTGDTSGGGDAAGGADAGTNPQNPGGTTDGCAAAGSGGPLPAALLLVLVLLGLLATRRRERGE